MESNRETEAREIIESVLDLVASHKDWCECLARPCHHHDILARMERYLNPLFVADVTYPSIESGRVLGVDVMKLREAPANPDGPAICIGRTVHVFKARPVRGDKPIPDMVIVATEEIPADFRPEGTESGSEGWLDDLRVFYEEEGRRVVAAMSESLPQGMTDGILMALLDLKRTVLSVRGTRNGGG